MLSHAGTWKQGPPPRSSQAVSGRAGLDGWRMLVPKEGGMSRTTWLPALVAVLAAGRLGAQTVSFSNLDESTYRYAVTEERRNIFAANLPLGPEERERFWKIYDDYVKEREPLEKERFALLQRFGQSYAGISDEQAMALAL